MLPGSYGFRARADTPFEADVVPGEARLAPPGEREPAPRRGFRPREPEDSLDVRGAHPGEAPRPEEGLSDRGPGDGRGRLGERRAPEDGDAVVVAVYT